ncbi:hypothetical protein [Photobacterium arenosum]|uniref:hypothetical protein n=1 Tax=Photobacterium arenosum TaxID=2774143 RepID=UPI00288984BF|nr:hypothetical protein [Photobacterium arenosum]
MTRQYVSPHSLDAIDQEIDKAETIISMLGTANQGQSYEQGIIDALLWVQGRIPPPADITL